MKKKIKNELQALTWKIEDSEKTIMELKKRLQSGIDQVNTFERFDADSIKADADKLQAEYIRLEELHERKRALEWIISETA